VKPTNCWYGRARSDGPSHGERKMALKLIRTTVGCCGALRVYEQTVADSSQKVQTLTTWDEPGAHVIRITWLAKRQALVASLVKAGIPKGPSSRPKTDPSIPFRDPLLSSRTTPQSIPRRTSGGRKSCRRTQRSNRATTGRSLADPEIAPDKKAVLGRNVLTNDSVARQSVALPLEPRKCLTRQGRGAR
jgi:hypothetical protein